jgi:DNA-binding NarL/FixJ family response regulator
MIFIYSNDQTLVSLCMKLFKNKYGAKHLSSKKELSGSNIGKEDILIIDFDSCNEKELPPIDFPCMVLVSIPQNNQALRLLRLGIRAYGNRYMQEENLLQAIATLKAGQIWLPPAIITKMVSVLPYTKTQEKEKSLLQHLTSREVEVAKWLVKGLSNKEIGEKMFVSIRTIKAHLTSIFKKTDCRDRLEFATRMK